KQSANCWIILFQIAPQLAPKTSRCPSTSQSWPDWAAISLALVILRQVIRSCGAGSPDSPTSSLDSMRPNLWVIESYSERLRLFAGLANDSGGGENAFIDQTITTDPHEVELEERFVRQLLRSGALNLHASRSLPQGSSPARGSLRPRGSRLCSAARPSPPISGLP